METRTRKATIKVSEASRYELDAILIERIIKGKVILIQDHSDYPRVYNPNNLSDPISYHYRVFGIIQEQAGTQAILRHVGEETKNREPRDYKCTPITTGENRELLNQLISAQSDNQVNLFFVQG